SEGCGSWWGCAVGKKRYGCLVEVLVLYRTRQKSFSTKLVKSDGVELIPGHFPPTGYDGVGQKAGHKILPDQRLDVLRDNKVLFHQGKNVGQIGKRAGQMCSAASRHAQVDQGCRLPRLSSFLRELVSVVVRADEDGIVEQHLRPWRLVIGIVQPDQRIPQKGRKTATRVG